mmetsp:Transcript_14388/g.18851  ORF Transcript_14388/g.18851 Transcript_14388/m.18851 type:complete len:116 (-) Transcript_14388:511-858(-)
MFTVYKDSQQEQNYEFNCRLVQKAASHRSVSLMNLLPSLCLPSYLDFAYLSLGWDASLVWPDGVAASEITVFDTGLGTALPLWVVASRLRTAYCPRSWASSLSLLVTEVESKVVS